MIALLILAAVGALGEAGPDVLNGTLNGRELILQVEGSDVVCRGELVTVVDNMGQGSLSCTDHRHGEFHWKLQEDGAGVAYGRLGDDPLTLTFD
jgi:hypothetical protein